MMESEFAGVCFICLHEFLEGAVQRALHSKPLYLAVVFLPIKTPTLLGLKEKAPIMTEIACN